MPAIKRIFQFDSKLGKVVEVKQPERILHRPQWPMLSDALGVAPEQIPAARQAFADRGIPIEYKDDGRAVITGPRHRKMVGEALEIFDLNGGYSDPQRK